MQYIFSDATKSDLIDFPDQSLILLHYNAMKIFNLNLSGRTGGQQPGLEDTDCRYVYMYTGCDRSDLSTDFSSLYAHEHNKRPGILPCNLLVIKIVDQDNLASVQELKSFLAYQLLVPQHPCCIL